MSPKEHTNIFTRNDASDLLQQNALGQSTGHWLPCMVGESPEHGKDVNFVFPYSCVH